MRLKKSLELAFNILFHSKLRSWLTIIGIIIGIAAVVSIVSISEGAQEEMESRFGELGADIITISPGFSRAFGFGMGPPGGGGEGPTQEQKNLTSRDINVLKGIGNVKYVMGTVSASGEIRYLGEGGDVSVTGVDESVWKDVEVNELESGRYLTKGDSYSVILGYSRAYDFFEKEVQVNRQVTIEGKIFKVVGILAEGEDDRAVIIPLKTARDILEDVGNKEFDSITVKVENVDLVDDTIETIEKKLMMSRGIIQEDEKDFTVSSVKELQETLSETMSTMAIFLGAIAAISLIVGAVGVSNTMFTAVLEKTKEIGIMKAIGAKNKDILMIFLLNAGMIGLVGGLGGVIVGSIASSYIGTLVGSSTSGGPGGGAMRMLSSTALNPKLLLIAFLVSIIIGMVAGVIPAYRASKLKPVDALRYE